MINESPVYLICVLSLVLFLSDWVSKKPGFKAFGIALLVIVLGAIFSNSGLLPSQANPTYDFIFEYVAPASLFLMLMDVNLTQLKKTGLPILVLFLLGSLGTVLGVFLATLVIKDGPLFEGLYPALAGMLAGTYTGGSINFNAVALHSIFFRGNHRPSSTGTAMVTKNHSVVTTLSAATALV